jgi:peptide/nickel transport system substrate-binding protein/oligopeptide transport system substrate-binding protein
MEDEMKQTGMSRRAFIGMATATGILGAGLAGCKKETAASSDGDGATSKITYSMSNPTCIDPYNTQDLAGCMVARQLFDPLLVYNFDTEELDPCACESYTASPEGDWFEFKIKEGNTFHNGEVVDAAAFQRGWNRLCNPKTGNSPSAISYHLNLVKGYDEVLNGSAEELSGLSCPDQYTFRVELTDPFMDFPMVGTLMCTSPVPEAALEDFDSFYLAPIGNGPFKMDGKWVDGQYINVTKYDDYKNGEMPSIDEVHFAILKDVETEFREFQAGNVDLSNIPTAQMASVEAEYGISEDGYTVTPGHQVLNGKQPATYFLTCNVEDPVIGDVNLRRAISLAINRDAIVQTLFEGVRVSADNLCAPGCQGYVEGQWAYSKYDKEGAEAILDQYYPKDANGSRNLEITLTYNMDGSHKQVMESIIGDLEAIGITVKSDTKEWASVVSDYNSGNFQIGRLGWIAEYPSIDNFLYPLCYTGNGDNSAKYSNSEVDAGLLKARATADESERLTIYENVNETVGDDCPYIPLMFYCHAKVGSNRIKKLYLTPIEVVSAQGWELES